VQQCTRRIVSCACAVVTIGWGNGDLTAGSAVAEADDRSRGTRQEPVARAIAGMENAGIENAVIGGNAVAAWVGQVDQSAVRFTQDVDLLPVVGQQCPANAGGVGQLVGVRHLLVGSPRLVRGEDIMPEGTQSIGQSPMHVLVGEERGRGGQAYPLSRMARSISSRFFS
jgi:hypothetical protein